MKRTVQWKGDNQSEVELFLDPFVVRTDKVGDALQITGLSKKGGLSIRLELGDSMLLERGRLGVTRGHVRDIEPMVEWTGENAQAVSDFLQPWNVDMTVIGADLHLDGPGEARRVVLHRGDRIVERGKNLVMSIAGKDHRV